MDTNQSTDQSTDQPTNQPIEQSIASTTIQASAAATPSVLGTKMPSTVAFAVAVLLFLMPFIDIKCNGSSLQTVSGVQLATGFKMKNNSSDNSFLNDVKTEGIDKNITKTATKSDDKDPNMYAMIALGLGILGLGLSFTNAKAALGGAMATGVASAGAMIGLMHDIKKNIKSSIPSTDTGSGTGLDNIGKSMSDSLNITVDFTSWFYIAIVAFLAAAFFCYKRMSAKK